MNSKRRIAYGIALLCLGLLFASCHTVVVHNPRPVAVYSVGPPPHAPAHGYRHKHAHGVELVYDAHLGVYVVAGYTNYYYRDRDFFRFHNEHWQVSASIDGPWKASSNFKLPKGFKEQKVAKKNGHKK